jgi:hypothetical protein
MDFGSLLDLWVAATFVGIAIRWLVGWNVELLTAILAGGVLVVFWDAGFQPGPLVAALTDSAPEFLAGAGIGLAMMHFTRSAGTNR